MARREDETIGDYESRINEMEKMRELEMRELKAQGKKYRPGMSFYEMNKQDIEEQRREFEREHGTLAQRRYKAFAQSMNPTQRKIAYEEAYGVQERERFEAAREDQKRERQKELRLAEINAAGLRGQGAEAAQYNMQGSNYRADKEFERSKYQSDRQMEIEAAKNETQKEIADINAETESEKTKAGLKGIDKKGEWDIKIERARGETEATKAAAQEAVWKSRYGDAKGENSKQKFVAMYITKAQKSRKGKNKSVEELTREAEAAYERFSGGGQG